MNNHRTSHVTSSQLPNESSNTNEEDQLNRINLQALQNRDPYITKIIDQAQRVCVFKFSAEKRQWERKDLEGTLFVYERLAAPFHGFVILSTVSRETFVQIIKASMEFKHTPAYEAFLQYKVDVGDIYGIWFISKNDCPRVTECLTRLTLKAKDLEQTKHQDNSMTKKKDIFSLFTQAQDKFQESKRKPDGDTAENSGSMPPLLARLLSTPGTAPQSTINKSAVSVAELEKQFLQPAENINPVSTTGRLMTPADFQKIQTPAEIGSMKVAMPVETTPTREDLRRVLIEMLRNDEDFLTGLYNVYAGKHNLRYNIHS